MRERERETRRNARATDCERRPYTAAIIHTARTRTAALVLQRAYYNASVHTVAISRILQTPLAIRRHILYIYAKIRELRVHKTLCYRLFCMIKKNKKKIRNI